MHTLDVIQTTSVILQIPQVFIEQMEQLFSESRQALAARAEDETVIQENTFTML